MTNPNAESQKPSKWKRGIVIFFISAILICTAYVYACGLTYGTGTRTGIVIKLSQKGVVFKTYEGELNLGGITEGDGTIMPNRLWSFSVERNNSKIYEEITKSEGRQVRLYYKEVYKTFFWQADTPYLIEKVEIIHPDK